MDSVRSFASQMNSLPGLRSLDWKQVIPWKKKPSSTTAHDESSSATWQGNDVEVAKLLIDLLREGSKSQECSEHSLYQAHNIIGC